MIFRGLTADNDWDFGKGKGTYLTKNAAIEANIRTRLYSWVNDCFFAMTAGIDWRNRMSRKNQKALLDADIKRIVLQSYGVTAINSYSSVLNGRSFSANINIKTIFSASYKLSILQGLNNA